MIKDLSNAIKALITSLATQPLATIGASLILLASFLLYKSYDLLQSNIVTPIEQNKRFKAQLTSASLVNDSIENLAEELNAHSVIIKQFHNGRHDLTGIPFAEATSTYYTPRFASHEQILLSSYNASLRLMWRDIDSPHCIILQRGVDPTTSRYFREYSLTRVAICPLTNLLKYPIGTITVGLTAENTLNDTVVLNKTQKVARGVIGYLNAY